jgi:hypothetical protein
MICSLRSPYTVKNRIKHKTEQKQNKNYIFSKKTEKNSQKRIIRSLRSPNTVENIKTH